MKQYIIIGLGRFGSSVARTLHSIGQQVLAVDIDEEKVKNIVGHCTRAVQCDATDETALRSLGARNFDVAVVTIGDIQANILVTMILKEFGIGFIVVKANNELHGKVLAKLGADKIVYPERDMGIRIARNLIGTNILDYIEISPTHSILEVTPARYMLNRSLKELDLRNRFGVNVMAIKEDDQVNITPRADDVIREGQVLVVIGHNNDLRRMQE